MINVGIKLYVYLNKISFYYDKVRFNVMHVHIEIPVWENVRSVVGSTVGASLFSTENDFIKNLKENL